MASSLWTPDMALGIPSMDAAHRALFEKLAQLYVVSDAGFPCHYAAMVARVESDFREEEKRMERIDFSGIRGHREQHAMLLGRLHRAAPPIMEGDVRLGRQTVALLPQWFALHIATLDAVLSFALQARGDDDAAPEPD